jgi:hypothetical protein
MSYTIPFNVSFALRGGDSKTVLYKVPLTPAPASQGSPASMFRVHFDSATQVSLVDAEGTITCLQAKGTENAPFASAAFVGIDTPITSVHQLARGSPIASAGSSVPFSLGQSVGLARILKGVLDAGDPPALFVAISSSWNTSGFDVALVTMRLTVKFEGVSNAVVYSESFPTPKAT